MRKAKKKVHPMPKLGWKDLLLYWTGMLIAAGCAVAAIFFPTLARETISFQDPDVIASMHYDGIHMLWLSVWFVILCFLIAVPYRKRYPVFGRGDIKYGPPACPRIFPLLMKNKPRYWIDPRKIAIQRRMYCVGTAVMLIFLLLSVHLYPNALFKRFDLRENGSITVVNRDNRVEKSYGRGDVESINIQARSERSFRSYTRRWYVTMIISLQDGEEVWFYNYDFRGDSEQVLLEMQSVKQLFSNYPISITGVDQLPQVVAYYDLNEYETSLLYQLFE